MRVQRDNVYKRADDGDLLMDVYCPATDAESALPLVLFVHGGPVAADDQPQPTGWGQYQSFGRLIAASGMVAATFNHRLRSRTAFDDPASDVIDAVSHARSNSERWGIDPSRLCIWCVSGGGPLISFVLRERPEYARCLVAYYARLDLSHVKDQLELDDRTVETYSAAAYLDAERPTDLPIFVARAGMDRPAINIGLDRFVQQALAANAYLEVMNHPHGRHAFDILDDDVRTREIIARSIEFVSQHI